MSREFIRADYLKVELELSPALPAREIAIAFLSELEFEVFEPNEKGLVAHIPKLAVNRKELDSVRDRIAEIAEIVWTESTVKTENWNAKWEEEYEPVNVEGLALVRAPFHEAPSSGLDIVIKPNMSFGTGHHDTTWMMIKALISLDVKGSSVLDMGCGTGVLAIAAKTLGASSVLAIDIEEGAVENTIENAALNSISAGESFKVDCGVVDLLTSKYPEENQIILANINRNVLVANMKTYDSVLAPSGHIIFSGFFTGDVEVMSENIHSLGWKIESVLERNGWACIICGKPVV